MSLPPVGSFFAIDNRRYEAQLEKDWQYILVDSDAKVLVVATEAIYEKVKNYPGKVSCGLFSSYLCYLCAACNLQSAT